MSESMTKLVSHREEIKDIIQSVAWMAASFGALITAWKAVIEMRRANVERAESRAERSLELRWRQAEAGKQLIDELLKNPKATEALRVLDIDGHTILIPGRDKGVDTAHDVLPESLRTTNMTLTKDEVIIREAFDELLGAIDRLEHYIRIGLTLAEDVMPPLEYYARRAAEVKDALEGYARFFEFHRALDFFSRYPQYQITGKQQKEAPPNGA